MWVERHAKILQIFGTLLLKLCALSDLQLVYSQGNLYKTIIVNLFNLFLVTIYENKVLKHSTHSLRGRPNL